MKKFIPLVLSMVCFATGSYAMDFFAGQHDAPESERDIKWSKCTWGDNINFETKPLPTKPGPTDHASSRYGHFRLDIDVDIAVGSLGCGDGSENTSTGRSIKVRRDMGISMATYNGGESAWKLDKCKVEVGGSLRISFWHEARGAGIAKIQLTDTLMNVKGDFASSIPANPLITNSERAGVIMVVEGKTQLNFNGGAVMDSLYKDDPQQWILKFAFKEKDGNLPRIYFNRRAQVESCDIELNVSDNVKAGKYVLMEFYDRRSGIGKPNKVTVNEEAYELGADFKIGGKTAKLYLGGAPMSKDAKTPNDLILEVK